MLGDSLGRLEKYILQNATSARKSDDARPPLAKRPSSQIASESLDGNYSNSSNKRPASNSLGFASNSLGFSAVASGVGAQGGGGGGVQSTNAFAVLASGTPYTSPSKSHLGSPATTVASSSVAYQTRKDIGQVAVSYNETLPDRGKFNRSTSGPLGFRCRVSSNNDEFENITDKYRFMYTPLWERAKALDKHLHRIQKDICERIQLPESSLEPVGLPSPETVWVVGRVVCESSTVS